MKRTADAAFSPIKIQPTVAIYFPDNGQLALHAYATRRDSWLEVTVLNGVYEVSSLAEFTQCVTTTRFYGAYIFVYEDGRIPRITLAHGDGFKSMFSSYSSIESVARRAWSYATYNFSKTVL